jgi:two-component system nitrogen regulation sensor histidine kinase NtrY
VENIGNIVEEFVQLAKGPTANMVAVDMLKITNEIVFSYRELAKNTEIKVLCSAENYVVNGDKTQLSQVMVNLIKNSIEAIDAKREIISANAPGKIIIKLTQFENAKGKIWLIIKFIDNGIGIPSSILSELYTPYVTTKAKGTGLGLTIVKKIIFDHGGGIKIGNNKGEGAWVKIKLAIINK